jgi:curli biogenesis system outer membrane secretion channel CsgG
MVLALSTAAFAQAEKKKIVVGDPKTKWAQSSACRGYEPTYADTIARSLRSKIVQTGVYRVVSREQLQKVLREHEMSMTGLSDPTTAKMLGGFLQADLVMATEVLCHPNHVEFIVSLVDVESAEIVFSKAYEMRDLKKTSKAMKDIIDILKKYAKTGQIGDAGKSEAMMMIDSKALHDASESIISIIEHSVPRVSAKVKDVNVYGETIKVQVRGHGWAGLYLKKQGSGELEAGTTGDMSSFEEGDTASSEDFKPKVAIGYIEDEDEDNEKMVDLFREGLLKEMSEADRLEPADDRSVEKLIQKMGKKSGKKDLEKLFKKGVDLLVTGRFSGEAGNRRIDFEVLSTYDGKRVTKIKYDSRL